MAHTHRLLNKNREMLSREARPAAILPPGHPVSPSSPGIYREFIIGRKAKCGHDACAAVCLPPSAFQPQRLIIQEEGPSSIISSYFHFH